MHQTLYSIKIKKLEISTIIGILDFERVNKQRIYVDVVIKYIYNELLDYSIVRDIIISQIVNSQYTTIESAIDDIINILLKKFADIRKIKLTITKPDIFSDCEVLVSRGIWKEEIF
jgi:dihydroneopterin aldolase